MPLSKERLLQLVVRSSDVVVATARDGTIAFYNDGASALLGYESAEVMGVGVALLYGSRADAKRVMACMRSPEYGGVGAASSIQTTFVAKSGEKIPVAITGTIVYDENGEEDGTIGFAKDIRAILKRDKLATLSEVAAGLSHQINSPLDVILNQMELLEDDICALAGERDSSVENERLDAVRREVQRVAGILARFEHMIGADEYATSSYHGETRMVDLSERRHAKRDPRLAGLRVLVVDDDRGITRTLKELLASDGCTVTTACDGEEALACLARENFDAVLSDVVMPKMNGDELFQRCRKLYPKLPVLLMTAFLHDKDHILKHSRSAGLEDVLFKPVEPGRLRKALLEVVGAGES